MILNIKKIAFSFLFSVLLALPSFAKDLTVSYIDIGQGDSELIELPEGKNILIDAGDREGANNLIAYLKERKIKKLDLIIITHPHLDHYGGLIKTLKDLKDLEIGQVFDSGVKTTSSTYAKLLEQFLAKKVKFKIPRKGEKVNFNNDISLSILAPQEPLLTNTKSDINNSSIVAKLVYKNVSFLFTGDIEDESQEQILESFSPSDLNSTILKVAHHGSRYTTSDKFLEDVNPKIAVISTGKGNTYGHPHKEALERINNKKIPLYRTDLNGTIVLTTDGTKYNISVQKKDIQNNNQSNQNKKININKASLQEIETLPTIGKKLAEKIINGRPYSSLKDLEKINGLTKKKIEKFSDLISF